jgi:hypothetical protein
MLCFAQGFEIEATVKSIKAIRIGRTCLERQNIIGKHYDCYNIHTGEGKSEFIDFDVNKC